MVKLGQDITMIEIIFALMLAFSAVIMWLFSHLTLVTEKHEKLFGYIAIGALISCWLSSIGMLIFSIGEGIWIISAIILFALILMSYLIIQLIRSA